MSKGVVSILCPTGEKVSKLVHHLEEKSPSSPVSWLINVGTCCSPVPGIGRDLPLPLHRARGRRSPQNPLRASHPAHHSQLVASSLLKTHPASHVRWEGAMEEREKVSPPTDSFLNQFRDRLCLLPSFVPGSWGSARADGSHTGISVAVKCFDFP